MVFNYYSSTDVMLKNVTNQLRRIFVVAVMKVIFLFE
jgi:hypothetical protein